jgi:uncharacterized beta barrel domain-containing protein DUF5777
VTRYSHSARGSFALVFVLALVMATPLFAQSQEDDDDAKLRPAEPDFALINLPTTLPLPVHAGNFRLTHRFAGNLRQGSFSDNASNLFGLDQGAVIGLEYRFGVMKHLEAAVYRTSFDKTFQFYGKYDAVHQDERRPIGISGIVAIEGTNNFQERYAPSLGASVSYVPPGDRLAVYAVPMWTHNSAAALGIDRDTFYVGLGGRVRFLTSAYLVAEVSPRVAGYAPGDPEYGFGIEKRVGGHFFTLTFTNTFSSTFAQVGRGGSPATLYLGFNLARKFF